MFCQAGDPPALQIHLDLLTSGRGKSFASVFRPDPHYASSALVQPNGDMDFRRYNQAVEIVIKIVDNTGLHQTFFDKTGTDGVKYHVFAYADGPAQDDALAPIDYGHHEMRNVVVSNKGMTVSFCYHNDDRGAKQEAPRSHPQSRYGLYLSDDEHVGVPRLVHPIIDNGANNKR